VANQEPEEILDKIEAHIQRHLPSGARVTVTSQAGRARPYSMPAEHTGVLAAAEVVTEHYGRPPYYVRSGGTLPIMDMFLQELNAYTVDVGFAQDDERMHSPNEFFRLADYERGQVVYVLLLERLGRLEPGSLAAR
jgi:acetylornithine deacetylase/succinyl-diaminopimelate desuccinylase-like protein